jgi:hypothetical protein
MATKRHQTMAKRAREQAVKEKRARKAERRKDRLAAAAGGETRAIGVDVEGPGDEDVAPPTAET